MNAPRPACFRDWQDHDVHAHLAWTKTHAGFYVSVQRFAANWGYLITTTTDVSFQVIDGKFDWDWTAMDACERAEKALTRLTETKEGLTP